MRLASSLLVIALALAAMTAARARAQDAASAPSADDDAAIAAGDESAEPAEDFGDLEALLDERVVTTASRGAEVASAAPATVFTITAREMHIYGIRTIDEALAYLGVGMYTMRARDYTSGLDVGAQGLLLRDAGRHILVLLDGHVMNGQDTGTVTIHEGLGVPLEAIDHLEVMLGAGSVMYGSNAMLAVINVVTRTAARGSTIHAVAELGVAAPMGVDGQPTTEGAPGDRVGLRYRFGVGATSAFELLGSTAQLSIQAEWLEELSNSVRVTDILDDGFQFEPGGTTWGGAATFTSRTPSMVASLRVGDFTLRLQGSHYYRNMPLVGTFSDPEAFEERNALRADLRHVATLAPEVTLSTRFYGDYTTLTERSNWTSPYWCLEGQIDGCVFQLGSVGRWAGAEQVLTIDWNLDSAIVTTIGYDIRGRDTTARPADYLDLLTADRPFTQTLPYIHQVTLLGAVFAQQVYRPWEWLTMNVGARLDVDSQFGARVSPRAAVVVTPAQGTAVRVSYAEAFRAPTSYEIFESDPTYRVAALGLRPEVVRTAELEWQQRIEWLTFRLRGFAAFYEDFIDMRAVTEQEAATALARGELAPTADPIFVVRYDNLQTLRSFGGSFDVSLRPVRGLTIAGSITVSDTRLGDTPIELLPVWMGNARIAYEVSPGGASVSVAAVFAGRRKAFDDIIALYEYELGEQLDLRATVAAPIDVVPGLRFRATVAYTVNPLLPYILNAPTEAAPDAAVVFTPVTSSLYGFVGLQYDLGL